MFTKHCTKILHLCDFFEKKNSWKPVLEDFFCDSQYTIVAILRKQVLCIGTKLPLQCEMAEKKICNFLRTQRFAKKRQ
jgi:hypothetical protein